MPTVRALARARDRPRRRALPAGGRAALPDPFVAAAMDGRRDVAFAAVRVMLRVCAAHGIADVRKQSIWELAPELAAEFAADLRRWRSADVGQVVDELGAWAARFPAAPLEVPPSDAVPEPEPIAIDPAAAAEIAGMLGRARGDQFALASGLADVPAAPAGPAADPLDAIRQAGAARSTGGGRPARRCRMTRSGSFTARCSSCWASMRRAPRSRTDRRRTGTGGARRIGRGGIGIRPSRTRSMRSGSTTRTGPSSPRRCGTRSIYSGAWGKRYADAL